MSKEIHVKCWPVWFNKWISRRKSFEARNDDRHYEEGDTLFQHEWDPATKEYTGRVGVGRVGYVLHHKDIPDDIKPGRVVFECPFEKSVIKPKTEDNPYG